MNKIQWFVFGIGLCLLGAELMHSGNLDNTMATSMVDYDMVAFAAYKLSCEISFVSGSIMSVLGMLFIACGIAEPNPLKKQ